MNDRERLLSHFVERRVSHDRRRETEYQYAIDELRRGDTWRMFRIMGEFVEGFEKLAGMEGAVTAFGSARTTKRSKWYKKAYEMGGKLAHAGVPVITGGGPGTMEAINRGAFEQGGLSVGLNIELPKEQHPNPYLTRTITFRYFFIRKVMLVKYSCAFVCFPGGFGTLDEFFEALTLIQTQKIAQFPVIMVGTSHWKGLMSWMEKTLVKRGVIDAEDLSAITLTDDIDEAVDIIRRVSIATD